MPNLSKLALPVLIDGQVQTIEFDLKAQTSGAVTGVKGNAETNYRDGNVNITPDNIGAVSTSANQGLDSTQQANARANIGAGTSSFSGNYSDLSGLPTIPTKTSQLTNDSGFITSYTDTKNTAGTTNTTSKIFLAGATSQDANPQTYSNVNCYASGGYLYSGGTKVSVEGHTHSYAPVSHASTGTGYGVGNASNYGHVKLSDNYTSSAGAAANSVGASSAAVYNTYNTMRPTTIYGLMIPGKTIGWSAVNFPTPIKPKTAKVTLISPLGSSNIEGLNIDVIISDYGDVGYFDLVGKISDANINICRNHACIARMTCTY